MPRASSAPGKLPLPQKWTFLGTDCRASPGFKARSPSFSSRKWLKSVTWRLEKEWCKVHLRTSGGWKQTATQWCERGARCGVGCESPWGGAAGGPDCGDNRLHLFQEIKWQQFPASCLFPPVSPSSILGDWFYQPIVNLQVSHGGDRWAPSRFQLSAGPQIPFHQYRKYLIIFR